MTDKDRLGRHPLLAKVLAFLMALLPVLAVYLGWLRPYQLDLGATKAEIDRPMAGDELNPSPSFRATRAITITGSPEEIWPWLLQMGYGRAGFYGYDLAENLGSPSGIRSAEEVLSELQRFRVGDEVPISAVASMRFHAIEPYRHLIWIGSEAVEPGVFTWALYPVDATRTRLVSRIRWSYHRRPVAVIPLEVFTEFTDHLAVRKILQGVKGRVEGDVEPMWIQNLELFTFVATASTFAAALLFVLLRPSSPRTWGVALLAGAIWLVSWYTPVPTALNVLLALAAIGAVWLAPRNRSRHSGRGGGRSRSAATAGGN